MAFTTTLESQGTRTRESSSSIASGSEPREAPTFRCCCFGHGVQRNQPFDLPHLGTVRHLASSRGVDGVKRRQRIKLATTFLRPTSTA